LSLQRCEGKNLESVLEQVRNRFGGTVTIIEANRLRKGGLGGFFAKECFEVVVDVDDEPGMAAPSAAVTELPAEFGLGATETFCERLLTLADDVSDDPQPARPTPAGPSVSTEQPQFAAVLESITRHMETKAAATLPAAGPAIDRTALARLGFPAELTSAAPATPAPAGLDPSAWLLGVLEQIPVPEPLPQGRGSVVVVAGGRDAALELARQMADELGLDADGLLVASPGYRGRAVPAHCRLTGVDAAAEARRSWRRRARPTIVAVEAAPGCGGEWARRVIDALEPTMVWGAADATRKPEDLFEWAEQLGGFDALGVTGLDTTVSPAAVLRCGIPVGRLEGRPATPALWASLLAPRLAA
jgi:hypothetical protein